MNALAQRYPALQAALPFVPLTELPTPLDRLDALAAELGIGQLQLKRDDVSARLYGGNKVRKLEYVLGDAQATGCDAVLTFGAAGSNHALATAIYARELGLDCYAVLTNQAQTPYVAATLRYHARLGTRLVHAGGYRETLGAYEQVVSQHATGSDRVYKVPWGGSSWLGATGFVGAGLELAAQLADTGLPDRLYLACGTMGTAVGLAIGLRLVNAPTRIVAVQVAPSPLPVADSFAKLFDQTVQELHRRDPELPMLENPHQNVKLREEFLGPGYADTTPLCLEAIRLARDLEDLRLETTYTGKALGALISDSREGRLTGQRVLFWNTYNSQSYPPDIDALGAEDLPPPFRKYLAD